MSGRFDEMADEIKMYQGRRPHHGKNIIMFRRMRDWNQKRLAEVLNVTQQTISNWEVAETLDDDVVEKVANALGIDPEYIKDRTQDDIMKYFVGNISGANSTNMVGNEFNNIHLNPIDAVKELYEKQIAKLEEEREKLLAENQKLKLELTKAGK